MFEVDIAQSKQLLIQAESLAEEKNIRKLSKKIFDERVLFHNQLDRYELYLDQKSSTNEIMELTRLENLIDRMLHKGLYNKEIEVYEYAIKMRHMIEAWER